MTTSSNPYEATTSDPELNADNPEAARSELLPVGIALLVLSILHIIGGLFFFVYVYSIVAAPGC